MEIKKIINEQEFKDFENAVLKIKLDCLTTTNKVTSFYRWNASKFIDTDKVIDDDAMFTELLQNYHDTKTNLETLYKKHESEYASIYDFEHDLFNNLKTFVSNQAVLASNNELPKRKLTTAEAVKYEETRNLYIQIIRSLDKQHADSQIISETLKEIPVEILANYVDKVEKVVDERFNAPNNISPREGILYDYLHTIIPFSSGNGDNLVTQQINLNLTRLNGLDPKYANIPTHLKALGFLENQLLLAETSLDKQGIGFDGYRFFNTETGNGVFTNTVSLNKTRLGNADFEKQSNFVMDEEYADMLISIHKIHKKVNNKDTVRYMKVVDGDTIITTKTLFKPALEGVHSLLKGTVERRLGLGYFCKVKEHNITQNTFSIALYYFNDPNSENGIQLLRLDKVAESFKGSPASHNLRGKEKIESTMHIHKYNLIDAVLKNYERKDSLGKMDIKYNFICPASDIYAAEELFNNKCGIYSVALNKRNRAVFERKPPIKM